jgi:hypothetical protein
VWNRQKSFGISRSGISSSAGARHRVLVMVAEKETGVLVTCLAKKEKEVEKDGRGTEVGKP